MDVFTRNTHTRHPHGSSRIHSPHTDTISHVRHTHNTHIEVEGIKRTLVTVRERRRLREGRSGETPSPSSLDLTGTGIFPGVSNRTGQAGKRTEDRRGGGYTGTRGSLGVKGVHLLSYYDRVPLPPSDLYFPQFSDERRAGVLPSNRKDGPSKVDRKRSGGGWSSRLRTSPEPRSDGAGSEPG